MADKNGMAHWRRQLRAQSISIQVSDQTRCNAGCLFCISRTTFGSGQSDEGLVRCDLNQLEIGLNLARQLGATHAILTGKADPSQEKTAYLCEMVKLCRKYLPLADFHTNGLRFLLHGETSLSRMEELKEAGLTMITFSVASFEEPQNRNLMGIDQKPEKLIQAARDLGLLVRCSLVVNKHNVKVPGDILDYVMRAGSLGAHMVVIREVWTPDVYYDVNREVYDWNKNNCVPIRPIEQRFVEISSGKHNPYGLQQRDPLPWGTPVFTMSGIFTDKDHGVNITFACCNEATSGPVLKSIVHKPNGRGYRGWDCPGDYLY